MILVAGQHGQLAHALAEQARGMPLVAIGRPALDLTDPDIIEKVVTTVAPSAIVNAAGYTLVDRAESDPALAFAVNRDGAARLAFQAQRRGVPFLHLSTDYVFDGRKPCRYSEEDRTAPLNVYGRSKLEGEVAVKEACPAALVLRTSWVYGPHGNNFVKTMIRLAQTQDEVRVVDDQFGAPTAAGDLAGAILEILRRLNSGYTSAGIFHLTARGETSWHGLAATIFSRLAKAGLPFPRLVAIKSAAYPVAAVRPANSRLDCRKIERTFGIRLPGWEASLDACLSRLLSLRDRETPASQAGVAR